MSRKRTPNIAVDAPLYHNDHRRPVSRRELIRQSFIGGMGSVFLPSALSLFATPSAAQIADDVSSLAPGCTLGTDSLRKIPFICFDLAGGANIAGSNVLIGQQGGQQDLLSTAGYSKLGLPADMAPQAAGDNINTELGLAFHGDSAFLRGIKERFSSGLNNTNGIVIPARSENDTANNPLNPLYSIARYATAKNGRFDANNMQSWGQLMALVGSRSGVSGGNSLAAPGLIVPALQPTTINRAADARGLINTGALMDLFNNDTAVAAQVLEAMARLSNDKLARLQFLNDAQADANLKDKIRCGYVKASDIAASFDSPNVLDPYFDAKIIGGTANGSNFQAIFSRSELDSDREFQKTAAIMKLVLEGRAGAGCITIGGFDYHTGDRSTGEQRDLRAGRCMGACLEYAARLRAPLAMYVFSDGSVSSNGMLDESEMGRGKGQWTSDNSSTAAAFMLVYNPNGQPELRDSSHQIGFMSSNASVDTTSSPAANNSNLLVDTLLLNYMALHGDEGQFNTLMPNTGLGQTASLIKFKPLNYQFS